MGWDDGIYRGRQQAANTAKHFSMGCGHLLPAMILFVHTILVYINASNFVCSWPSGSPSNVFDSRERNEEFWFFA